MSNLIGRTLDHYHVLELLGQGGMATVYKAYDTRLERVVAVKVIRKGAFPAEQLEHILRRFQLEAKALAHLTHPNIVPVIEYGEHEGSPYLIMPYFPGGTLKERIGQPWPWQEALRLLIPIADALAYAHRHNILHRDVKPSNILLTEEGQPMLTDFGIAKILDLEEGQTLTVTGVGIGTPEYMSPEQGLGKKVDARTDIYALGVVLYEMLTGRRPYTADTPMAVVFKHVSEPLPRPTEFRPDLPEAVEHILLKALAKDPDDRYPDMEAMKAAMEQALAGSHAVSRPAARVSDASGYVGEETIAAPLGHAPGAIDEAATIDKGGVVVSVPKTITPPAGVAKSSRLGTEEEHRGRPRPVWLWAGVWMLLLLVTLLSGGYVLNRRRLASQATAVARAKAEAAATARMRATATARAEATALARVRATAQAKVTATAQMRATVQAKATAAAQMRATAQAEATATAQMRATATARAKATATAQTKATATARARATAIARMKATAQAKATAIVRIRATSIARAKATAIPQVLWDEIKSWNIIVRDTFVNNANGWSVGDQDNDYYRGSRYFSGGKLVWRVDVSKYKNFVAWIWPRIKVLTDFYLSVEARRINGPVTSACYGLWYRGNGSNYYIFEVCDNQMYKVSAHSEKGGWQTLLGWQKSGVIRPGQVNKLAVLARGSNFRFFINDIPVNSLDNTRWASGRVGIVIELYEGATGSFEFDNFTVLSPQ